ncbi:hypothetical protein D770_04225 [Flammeovirgaceae bacterium 311]|nr:hypothetical protein D770_04225 [Flammeovirgaceae bacterium 311]
MKDNPYAAAGVDGNGERDPSITIELEEWRDAKRKREKKLRLLILGILIPLVALIALLTAIL